MAEKLPRDTADAIALADACIERWDARDERMLEDQRLWELEEGPRKKYEEKIAVNDNATALDKYSQEVARAELQISCAPRSDEDRPIAQAIEDACYWAMEELQQAHVRKLRSPFKYEAAMYSGLRGWVVAESLLAPPSDPLPWRVRLLDPRQIYPDTDDGEPQVVVHRYYSTYGALRAYWGEKAVEKAFEPDPRGRPRSLGEPVLCYGFYTDTELAVCLETRGWLKRPVEHGYGQMPIVIGVAPGAPYRATEQGEDTHVEYLGTGLLRTLKGYVESKTKVAQMLRRVLSKTAAPPVFAALSDPKATVNDVATEPNEVTLGRPGDSINPIVPPPVALQHATALLSMLQDGQNKVIPATLWGDQPSPSGYDRLKAVGSGMSVLMARMDMLAWWYQALLRLMLRQFAAHGEGPLQFLAQDRETGLRTASGYLDPLELMGAHLRLEVKWGRLQHQDMMAMGNLAALLTDRGLISHEFALSELLGADNPQQVMKAAMRDQFYKDPALLRMRVLMEKAYDQMDPIGAQLARMLLLSETQKFSLMAAGQAPQPAGPGPQQPPLPNQGLPQQTLPYEAAQGAGLPPGMNPMGPPQAGAGLQFV